jgi:hypothetical protein
LTSFSHADNRAALLTLPDTGKPFTARILSDPGDAAGGKASLTQPILIKMKRNRGPPASGSGRIGGIRGQKQGLRSVVSPPQKRDWAENVEVFPAGLNEPLRRNQLF